MGKIKLKGHIIDPYTGEEIDLENLPENCSIISMDDVKREYTDEEWEIKLRLDKETAEEEEKYYSEHPDELKELNEWYGLE